jgi:ATP-dependent DNA ligase
LQGEERNAGPAPSSKARAGPREGKNLVYAGKVENGFSDEQVKRLYERTRGLTIELFHKTPPRPKIPRSAQVSVVQVRGTICTS